MVWLRSILDGRAGKPLAIAIVLIVIGLAIYQIKSYFVPSAVAGERERVFIDATTGKGFDHELKLGETFPVEAPSGNKSGYPAELCYWTKDGGIKKDPTPVLLNSWIGKPGPTFCPDCGRLVVGHNPMAMPGMRPPPTREEYEKEMKAAGHELLHSVANSN
jgi:hypothetical protein